MRVADASRHTPVNPTNSAFLSSVVLIRPISQTSLHPSLARLIASMYHSSCIRTLTCTIAMHTVLVGCICSCPLTCVGWACFSQASDGRQFYARLPPRRLVIPTRRAVQQGCDCFYSTMLQRARSLSECASLFCPVRANVLF